MAVKESAVTVGTTGTALHIPSSDNVGGYNVVVQVPANGTTIYLGGTSGVVIGTGFPLAPGSTFSMDLNPNESLYAVVATGSQAVNCIEKSV